MLLFSITSCSDFNSTNGNNGIKSATNSVKMSQKSMIQQSLFTLVHKKNLQFTTKQKSLLSKIQNRRTTATVQIGRLAENSSSLLKKGKSIVFPVAPNENFVAIGKKFTYLASHDIFWAGPLKNQNGWVQIVLTKKGVTGTIRTDSIIYSLEPIGNRLQTITRIDQSKIETDSSPEYPSGALIDTASARATDSTMQANKKFSLKPNAESGGLIIDVLVLYTPRAKHNRDNINGLIEDAIEQTNTSYSRSNVNVTLRLKHTANTNYNVYGQSYKQIIKEMEDSSDGIMDNISQLRNQYLADIVILITDWCEPQGNGCADGKADAILATPNTAFAAVYDDDATTFHVFAHEVGHLFGARHDNDPKNTPFKYGHGYDYSPHGTIIWATIMEHNNRYPRIGYWSNPNVSYNGHATGTSDHANNALVIKETRWTLREFRTLDTPSNFTLTNRYHIGEHPHFTWTKNPDANYYFIYRCITSDPGDLFSCPSYQTVLSGPYPPGVPAQWTDVNVIMANTGPHGQCVETAIYYMTDENLTGESSPSYPKIAFCIESNR
jgi:hypothetical protein